MAAPLSRSALRARDALVLQYLSLADAVASAVARRFFPLVERECPLGHISLDGHAAGEPCLLDQLASPEPEAAGPADDLALDNARLDFGNDDSAINQPIAQPVINPQGSRGLPQSPRPIASTPLQPI